MSGQPSDDGFDNKSKSKRRGITISQTNNSVHTTSFSHHQTIQMPSSLFPLNQRPSAEAE
jgi:hypothetical protein